MNPENSNTTTDNQENNINIIDHSSGGNLGFTSSAPPEKPQIPASNEPIPSKDKE